jgi:hypothetical protein
MLQDYDDQLQRRAITLFAQEGEAYQKSLQAVRAGRSTALTRSAPSMTRPDKLSPVARDAAIAATTTSTSALQKRWR